MVDQANIDRVGRIHDDYNRLVNGFSCQNKFVISRREAGLGDCIASLIPAWRYARQTGRTLIIDWRNSFYLPDRDDNGFTALFEPVDEIAGVPVICDSRVGAHLLPSRFLARGCWKSQAEVAVDWLWQKLFAQESPYTLFWRDAQQYELQLLRSGREPDVRFILFKSCLADAMPSVDDRRAVLRCLKPVPHIQRSIDSFAAEHFSGKHVIAAHVRHGNGGNIMGHTRHWVDPEAVRNKILKSISSAMKNSGPDAVFFLCTDSIEIKQFMEISLPDVLVRGKFFRQRGAGELHGRGVVAAHEQARTLGEDALTEMLLLARTDELLCFPSGSLFSFYARTVENGPKIIPIDRRLALPHE